MATSGWVNPLDQLAPIEGHPDLSATSSPCSSPPESPGRYGDLRETCVNILKSYQPVNHLDDTAKVLMAFLDNLCKQGQMVLMEEMDRFDADQLRQLRQFLVDAILRPMTAAGGHPPCISPSPSNLARDSIDASMALIAKSSRDEQHKLKKDCLARDGNQCAFTHLVDISQIHTNTDSQAFFSPTECAHILPFALRSFNEESAKETANKVWIWWALSRYFPYLRDQISCETINQHRNAITLATPVHLAFGAYNIALEPLSTVHHYRRHVFPDPRLHVARDIPATVVLQQHDPSVPMPNSDFFKLHYQVAKILNVSGIGDKIEEACRKSYNQTPSNIAPDGSTDLESILGARMVQICI